MEKMNGNKTNGDKVNGIKVINKNRVIEITKKFEKAASYFGTDEYKALQEVKRDYPEYTVVVKKAAKRVCDSFKGLTYEYMEKYIKTHDNAAEIMNEYLDLRALSDEAMEIGAESLSYAEIKEWFLGMYPAIAKFFEKRTKIVNGAKNNKAIAA